MYGEEDDHIENIWKNELSNAISAILKEGPKIAYPELSLRIERINSNGHFGNYRLYIVNCGNMNTYDVRVELLDISHRDLKFDDSDQEEKVASLGSRILAPGNEYSFFMRCDHYPYDRKFKFRVIGKDTSGEVHQVDLWKELPET